MLGMLWATLAIPLAAASQNDLLDVPTISILLYTGSDMMRLWLKRVARK
jgi:hypothetical protein